MHGRMFAYRWIARFANGKVSGCAPPTHHALRSWQRAMLVVAPGLVSAVALLGVPTATGADPPDWANPLSNASGSAAPDSSSSTTTTSSVSPAVTALLPTSVTAGGGAPVTITGTAFTGATAVDFGTNASSTFTVQSDTSIAAVAPVGVGTVNVRVVTPAGTSDAVKADRLAYVPTGQLPVAVAGSSLEVGGAPTTFRGVNAV